LRRPEVAVLSIQSAFLVVPNGPIQFHFVQIYFFSLATVLLCLHQQHRPERPQQLHRAGGFSFTQLFLDPDTLSLQKIVSSLSLATEWFGLLSPVSSQWWITSPCRCTGRLLAPSHVECGVQTNIIDLCCPVYYCGSIDRWHSSAQGAASSRHHSSAAAGCYCNGIGVTIVTSTRVPAATDLAAVLAIDTLMSSAIGHSSLCCCDGSCGSFDY
jgi:hypothetical protein